MAVDIFLKLNKIKGESKGKDHIEEIDVLSWSWGMSQSGTTHLGSGAGSGKVNVQDLSITKYVDKASADLMKFCCNGDHIESGKITVRKASGAKPIDYLTIELKEIIVAAVTTGGIGSDDRMTENVTLNFGHFKLKYTQQNDDGSEGAKPEVQWDIPLNAEG